MKKTKTMGFIKSEKTEEKRIALLPEHLSRIKYCDSLYFEKGYGNDYGITDQEYMDAGCHIAEKADALRCDILCDTKIGEAAYLEHLENGKVLFGWIHAGHDKKLTHMLKNHQHTCYAWEDMYEYNRHLFWKNNQIAGAGGVFNALQYTGWMPYGKKAAIIGRGDVAFGAFRMLSELGVQVNIYNRDQEKLFQMEASQMDILVIAVRWNTTRQDHLLNDAVLEHLKKDAILIDISADPDGAIQASTTTDILHAVYKLHHTLVYSVNNIPSIFFRTASEDISKIICSFIDQLILDEENDVLKACKIIAHGKILDQHIIEEQKC